ncbi:ribonuclease T2 family protein [Roseibium sp. Sym1]|uniref:ribonuclease T2 family protein n=1 Tax=Roseibium sp. Sym1 TaxID=3016006 RepID=UPI0022B4DB7C|nr:ribonuclease T [Roseibium sp. Sym1]
MAPVFRFWQCCAVLLAALTFQQARADEPGKFDFYVLALSWSPTYCKQEGEDASRHQCDVRNPFRFIVHGLWPQYERGFPESCPGAPQRIDRQIAVSMEDIMPSHNLVFHEWRKHGTCSGLSPEAYFQLTRAAFEKIIIPGAFRTLDKRGKASPATVEKAFRLANPGLNEDAMAVTCDRGELEEVRICLTRDLEFRTCRQVDRSGCRAGSLSVPPPRAR